MARSKADTTDTTDPTMGEQPGVDLPPLTDDAAVVANALANNPAPSDEPPAKVGYFRVTRGGYILEKGYRTQLREGKIVDTLNYDIARLKTQGIRLEEVGPEDRMSGAIGSTFD